MHSFMGFLCLCRTYSALADGSHTFQVQALGTAGISGTAGPPVPAMFLVDTTAPVISNLRFALASGAAGAPAQSPSSNPATAQGPSPDPAPAPAGGVAVALPSGAFTAAFDVTDGVLGSGVNGCAPCCYLQLQPSVSAVLQTSEATHSCSSLLTLLQRAAAVA